jgi:hypothetical protein
VQVLMALAARRALVTYRRGLCRGSPEPDGSDLAVGTDRDVGEHDPVVIRANLAQGACRISTGVHLDESVRGQRYSKDSAGF